MSRKLKNVIMALIVVVLACALILTMYHAGEIGNANEKNMQTQMQSPPENSNAQGGSPPKAQFSDGQAPGGQAPGGGKGMGAPSGNGSLSILCFVLLGIESLILALMIMYLILSKFNARTFKETFKNRDKVIIYLLAVIILTGGLVITCSYMSVNYVTHAASIKKNAENVSASGAAEVTAAETLDGDYKSSAKDESAILVKDGGALTLNAATINKSGSSTNTENSEFYGINSGILVTKAASAVIKDTAITTAAAGSNAVFSTGTGSKITISDSTIRTTGKSSSRGLDATYGGYITANNVNIATQGGSCAALATDRGEGTVTAKNSTLETNGAGSPVIYSTGKISIDHTKGTANGSQSVVIEGKNSATVKNSKLICSGTGNRNKVDNAGVMIYQSMSGDAGEGTGTFTCKNSSITLPKTADSYKSAPMFFVTNTDAAINLEAVSLSYGSGVLLSAKGTGEWGKSGSNGGAITLNATNQKLAGNIELDKLSTLTLNLKKSAYSGTINADNSAKNIKLALDKNSKITLTGDSYVTSLEDADSSYSNIDLNGHTLYVNGDALN